MLHCLANTQICQDSRHESLSTSLSLDLWRESHCAPLSMIDSLSLLFPFLCAPLLSLLSPSLSLSMSPLLPRAGVYGRPLRRLRDFSRRLALYLCSGTVGDPAASLVFVLRLLEAVLSICARLDL